MDTKIFNLIHNLSGKSGLVDWLGIFFASYLPILLVAAFIVILFLRNGFRGPMQSWQNRWYQFFLTALSILMARGLVVEVIRFFYTSPRPYVALSFTPLIEPDFTNSFPSGHAAIFFALATAIFFFNRRWSYYFFVGVALVGLGRIFVGVHWPSDIVGGAIIGVASALAIRKILPEK